MARVELVQGGSSGLEELVFAQIDCQLEGSLLSRPAVDQVQRETLAVLTAEENRNRGSGGSVSVTIGPTIIEGDINGVDDFEERMDRRDAELLKKMNAALKSMAKAQ